MSNYATHSYTAHYMHSYNAHYALHTLMYHTLLYYTLPTLL